MINDKWRPKITQIESSKNFNYGVDKKKTWFLIRQKWLKGILMVEPD